MHLKETTLTLPVKIELSRYQLLKERLLADYPDADKEFVFDTLGGNH